MILTKALLVAGGNKGMKLGFTGFRKINDQFMAEFEDNRKDKMPVPTSLRTHFKKLKYYFLTMIGLWDEGYTRFLTEDFAHIMNFDNFMKQHSDEDYEVTSLLMMRADTILKNTTIIGFEVNGEQIKIHGTYEHIEGKPYTPNLPFINEGDDYAFYHEALEIMKSISNQIMNYMKSESLELEEVKKLLLELQSGNPDDVERIQKQDDQENLIELMNKLESQALVIPLDGSLLEKALEEADGRMSLKSKNTISKKGFDVHQEIKEKEEIEPEISQNHDFAIEENPDPDYVDDVDMNETESSQDRFFK